jgi:hypothetical protein
MFAEHKEGFLRRAAYGDHFRGRYYFMKKRSDWLVYFTRGEK